MIRMIANSATRSAIDTARPVRRFEPALAAVTAELATAPDARAIFAQLYPDSRPPTLIVDGHTGAIVHANGPAQQMLAARHFMRAAGDRIDFCTAETNAAFKNAVRSLSVEETATRRFALRTEHGVYNVSVAPVGAMLSCFLRPGGAPGEIGPPLLAVTLRTSQDLPDPDAIHAVSAAFGLSPSEARLLPLFMRGATLREIARRYDLALATVRQHMKSIMQKTDCNRQVDLAILLTRLCR